MRPTIFSAITVTALLATQAGAESINELRDPFDLYWAGSDCLSIEAVDVEIPCTAVPETRMAMVKETAAGVRIISFEVADDYSMTVAISSAMMQEVLALQANQAATK